MTTRDEAVQAAGAWFADALEHLDTLTPRQVAERAADRRPDVDVDAIEDKVRRLRGMPPLDRSEPAPAEPEPHPAPTAPRQRPGAAATPSRALRTPAKPATASPAAAGPLAALAGLSRAEKAALVEALRDELGEQ